MRLSFTVVMVAVATIATGCGAAPQENAAKGDPSDVFNAIVDLREHSAFDAQEPRTLAEALPNSVTVISTAGRTFTNSWSDSVVVGHVSEVSPGDAIKYDHPEPTYTGPDEEAFHKVQFDDPTADERNVLVSMDVDWSTGDKVGDSVEFRMGVVGGADPDKYVASLRGLDHVVVLLATREDGRDKGDYYPILSGGLLGEVGPAGSLSFPGLGSDEARFLSGIDTVDDLRSQSQRPTATVNRS